jgi:hypothetical protein
MDGMKGMVFSVRTDRASWFACLGPFPFGEEQCNRRVIREGVRKDPFLLSIISRTLYMIGRILRCIVQWYGWQMPVL